MFQSNFFKGPFICLLRRHLNLSDAVNHFCKYDSAILSLTFSHGLMEMGVGGWGVGGIFHTQKFTQGISWQG